MKIWLIRHGQTNLNRKKLMQGRTDEPLNETGVLQAEKMARLLSNVTFDAVYASPLDRAITTGAIVGRIDRSQIQIDERLIETDFGRYEKKPYAGLGVAMTLFWALPEVFPAPETVETIDSMVLRSSDFLRELEKQPYENVLIAAHGGILRAVSGYLSDRRNGILWRPKMKNCEARVFESDNGIHRLIEVLKA